MKAILLPLLLFVFSFPVKSNDGNSTTNIDNICASNTESCLQLLPLELNKTELQSHRWFNLQLYFIHALFSEGKYEQLKSHIDELFKIEQLPVLLAMRCNVYYAKILVYFDEIKQSEQYKVNAQNALTKLIATSTDPNHIIDYANFQMNLNDHQGSLLILKEVEEKFRRSKNMEIKSRVNGELGHAYKKLKQFENARIHYKLSHKYSLLIDNVQLQILRAYNAARSEQFLNNIDTAILLFSKVLEQSIAHKREQIIMLSHFRLAQLYSLNNQWEKSNVHSKQLDLNQFSTKQKVLIKELKAQYLKYKVD